MVNLGCNRTETLPEQAPVKSIFTPIQISRKSMVNYRLNIIYRKTLTVKAVHYAIKLFEYTIRNMNILISSITIIIYLWASFMQNLGLHDRLKQAKIWLFTLGLVAICLHALLLHQWIDINSGQNLNFFNMLSLSAWLISLLVLVVVMVKPVEILALFIFPVAALSIVLVLLFPNQYIINTAAHPDTLFHILLSVLTFCILCVAGLMAILLTLQVHLLRYKKASLLIQKMPPLETMETLLFQIIALGFILLSVVLVTSFYFYYDIILQQFAVLQKTICSVIAWVIFAVLLLGRHQRGWRGNKAIYSTLCGVLLLVFAYFGSGIMLEVLH